MLANLLEFRELLGREHGGELLVELRIHLLVLRVHLLARRARTRGFELRAFSVHLRVLRVENLFHLRRLCGVEAEILRQALDRRTAAARAAGWRTGGLIGEREAGHGQRRQKEGGISHGDPRGFVEP
jgi:hypothetical protein